MGLLGLAIRRKRQVSKHFYWMYRPLRGQARSHKKAKADRRIQALLTTQQAER